MKLNSAELDHILGKLLDHRRIGYQEGRDFEINRRRADIDSAIQTIEQQDQVVRDLTETVVRQETRINELEQQVEAQVREIAMQTTAPITAPQPQDHPVSDACSTVPDACSTVPDALPEAEPETQPIHDCAPEQPSPHRKAKW